MKRRLKAYKKTVSIVDESTIALYESLGREKKGFLMESNDKENGRYTFMGVEPEALIQSDGESLVITKADGTKEVRRGNPLERLKEYYSEFEIVKEDYLVENGGIIFPNPNAPTAVEMQLDDIEYIIKNNRDSVVIIDEAYADFGDVSVLGLVNKYENLLVVRTYSKSRALAGMRIGYAIGSKTLISALKAVKFSYNSYTMNYVSIYAGAAAINDDKYFKEIVSKVINTREKAKDTLKKLGFSFTDSKTNFLFATHKSVPAEEIFEELKKRKIYVRYFNKPRINNYLRITIGTDEEMEKLYEALKEIVK